MFYTYNIPKLKCQQLFKVSTFYEQQDPQIALYHFEGWRDDDHALTPVDAKATSGHPGEDETG